MTLLLVLAAACAAAVLTELVRRSTLRRGLLDRPNERSSHTVPTPRGGGLSFVVVVTLAAASVLPFEDGGGRLAVALLVGGVPVAVVGLVDDLRDVSAAVRAAVHALAALAALLVLVPLGDGGLGAVGSAGLLVAGVLGLVWLVNLYNFMDGIDGLAGGQAVVAAAGRALLARGAPHVDTAAWVLAGAVLGFLLLNAPPARIFMGDVGSGFLGMVLGLLVLETGRSGGVPLPVAGLVLAPFVVDATATLLRRVLRGDRWYAAHREHAYQRLVLAGASHRAVSVAYLSAAAALGLVALPLRGASTSTLALAVLSSLGLLLVAWAAITFRTTGPAGPRG